MKLQMFQLRTVAILAAIILLLASRTSAGETVIDEARGFTLTLPEGFLPKPDLVGAAPGIVYAFVQGEPADEELDIILFIKQLRGKIGPERLKSEDLPPEFKGRLFTTKWQGYDVDAFAVPEITGDTDTITYNVQIPLKGAAIQLMLFGPADRDAELNRLLAVTLAGLEGESSWIRSALPSSLASSPNYGVVLLVLAVALILSGLVLLWFVSQKAPRGVVFAIAAATYCSSFTLDDIRMREIAMLTGALRMLGFAGGILGIVDLLRKRKPLDVTNTFQNKPPD